MDSTSNNSKPPDVDKITAWVDDMRCWPNVMYGDIYNYLISSKTVDGQEMKNFKSLQSYNFFQSGNVGQIVQHTYDNKEIMLKTDVRASQNITRNNEVYVLCQQDGTIVKGWCSCMAGQGHSCSHVGALLWKIEHAVRNNYTGVACTDESAIWNRGTKRNIEPRPLSSIQFTKPKVGSDILEDDNDNIPGTRDTPTYLSDAEYKDSINNSHLLPLFNIKGTTAHKAFTCAPFTNDIVQQAHGDHSSLNSCGKCYDFYKKFVIVDADKINKLQEHTQTQSANALWRDARKIRITASSAVKVPIKETTNATSFIREHLHPKFVGNKYTKYGLEQEPIAINFLKTIGLDVQNKGMFISADENWLSASPDGIINCDTLLEIKSPFPTNWSNLDEFIANGKYDVIKNIDNTYELKVKGSRGFYMQIQLTLYCSELKKCKLLIWKSADDNIIVNVEYNQTYVEEVIQRLKTFYIKKMMHIIVDEMENDRLVLGKMFKSFMR